MTSYDGRIWNPVYAIVQTLFFVDWIPDLKLFIALGVDNIESVNNVNVLTSVDGINWRPSVVPSSGGWLGSCWSPELGIVVAIAGGQLDEYSGSSKLMTSSLKGRPPTSYNVFDSCFNRIDESGNWTFANINVRSNILPLDNSSSDLGSGTKRWRNIYVNDLSVSTINGQPYNAAIVLTSVSGNIIPSTDNQFKLGDVSRNWSNAYIRDISVSNTITINGSRVATTQHIKNTIPYGVIMAYYTTPAPPGWAICDGSNGTPDLRGRFILGAGQGIGVDSNGDAFVNRAVGISGGAALHTLTKSQMPSHTHSETYTQIGYSGNSYANGSNRAAANTDEYASQQTGPEGGGAGGVTVPHNNMPPFYVLVYIMKTDDYGF